MQIAGYPHAPGQRKTKNFSTGLKEKAFAHAALTLAGFAAICDAEPPVTMSTRQKWRPSEDKSRWRRGRTALPLARCREGG